MFGLKKVPTLGGARWWAKHKCWRLKIFLLSPFKAQVDALYDEGYYGRNYLKPEGKTTTMPQKTVEILLKRFQPGSVVDLGCGVAGYLHFFQEKGCEVLGVEGSRHAIDLALIPSEKIIEHDLRKPLKLPKKFDLAICSDVAEHIANQYMPVFLETVASSSDTILFSSPVGAAKNYIYHCNEKPQAEWIQLFKEKGFEVDSQATQETKAELENARAYSELQETLLVFRKTTPPATR